MRRPTLSVPVPPRAQRLLARTPIARALTLGRRSVREFLDDHCPQLAAAISYHVLFSIFPMAIVAVGVLGLISNGAAARDRIVDAVTQIVPLSDSGQRQLEDLLASMTGQSGALGLLGLVGVIWSASGVMTAVRIAVNIAWDVDRRRPFLRGKAMDLLLLLAIFVVLAAALALTFVTSLAHRSSESLPGVLADLAGPATTVATIVVTVAVVTALFTGLYVVLPAVRTRPRDVWPGALAAALAFEILQYGFSVYLAHFADYNRVYGSLGAIVAFLFFVYLGSMVFLFGAEVASEYPRLADTPARAGDRPSRRHDVTTPRA